MKMYIPSAIGVFIVMMWLAWPTAMTNDEIIREVKACESVGLCADVFRNGITSSITRIQCLPKRDCE